MDLDPSLLPHWYYHLFDCTPFGWPLSTACNIVPWSAYTKLCQFIFIAFIEQCSIYDNLNTGPWEFLREFIENFRWGSSNQLIFKHAYYKCSPDHSKVSGKRNPARIWEITSFWIVFQINVTKFDSVLFLTTRQSSTLCFSMFYPAINLLGIFCPQTIDKFLVFLTSKLCL